jgi:hypothetical protein
VFGRLEQNDELPEHERRPPDDPVTACPRALACSIFPALDEIASRNRLFFQLMQMSKSYPHRLIDNNVVFIHTSRRVRTLRIVKLHPKPGPAGVLGSSPSAAAPLLASSRADGQALAKQDNKSASHARDVRAANHHFALLVRFELVCERCQFEHIEVSVRADQRKQRSLQGSASAGHKCYVHRGTVAKNT